MSDQDVPGKVCINCHRDCANRPRVKDRAGRYICRECLNQMKATGQTAPLTGAQHTAAAAAVAAPAGKDVFSELIDEAVARQPEACEHCGVAVDPTAVVCVHCGYNKATGRSHKTKVVEEKAAKEGRTLDVGDSSLVHLGLWIAGGVAGGAVGATIWTVVCYLTHYEVGYIASLVGALTGGGVMLFGRASTNIVSGAIAVVLAGLAIMLGKYASIYFVVGPDEAANAYLEYFDLFDILWFVFAFAAAYQLGANDYIDD